MKKMLSGLFVTILMASGLLAASAGSASAACAQYTGCVNTKTTVTAPSSVKQGKKATVCGKVKAKSGNAKPVGKLKFKIEKNQGSFKFTRKVNYSGGKVCVTTGKLNGKGGYTVGVKYVPQGGSVFNPSSAATGFDVN